MIDAKEISINPLTAEKFLKSDKIYDILLDKTAYNVVQYLKEKKLKIATAESCTGGLLSYEITKISGSSDVFDIGICTYASEMKTKILGVSPEIIEKYNVVSCETAKAMASGLQKISNADVCITTTGVAGPSGGSETIPVGTVCFGFYFKINPEHIIYTTKINFSDYDITGRENVRTAAAYISLCIVYEILNGVIDE